MTKASIAQKWASKNFRAWHLANDGPDVNRARDAVRALDDDEQSKPGRILSALRRSPLVGAEIDISRSHDERRRIDL